ncbi:MAG: NAD-dependent epimerase/dehydratase family protein [Ignavibacteriae bacterium]|nr:NAD-dependent epimerase/dehydratase family protein [Ignavibacteriota bacterium]
MKVLVTGGTGFTGKALTKRLLKEGFEVIVLDNKEYKDTLELKELGAKVVIGSVTDKVIVDKLMDGVDIVQHMAAAFREMGVPENYYHQVNVDGTRILLESALNNNIKKFIYCSTCGVHGNIDEIPADENAPIQPADYYQESKYEAEVIVNEFQKKGLKTVILRGTATYGPGDPGRFLMIYKKVSKGNFPMFGSGKTLYHPVFINNLIDAHMIAMDGEKGVGESYLIADENYVEIENLVREVGKSLDVAVKVPHYPILPLIIAGHFFEKTFTPFGLKPPIFPRRVDWFRQNRAFNIDKAKRELGYQPKVSLSEGLKITADWYKKEGLI